MRNGLALSGIAAASLLAAGLIAAAPAYAATPTASVQDSGAPQYHVSCDSQSTCNSDTTGTLDIQFNRTGSTSSDLGIFYQITNGTAVDGTDFNVPATGEVIIPAGQFNQDLAVPLVNEGMFNATKNFTIAITGTTPPVTITQGTATATISGGNIPPDCSFTWISSSSQSLTCTQRPATQVWNLQVYCFHLLIRYAQGGNQVTGEGTSTVSNCTGLSDGSLIIDS
jgi:Calx-beta domain